jgi:hypothetical protein
MWNVNQNLTSSCLKICLSWTISKQPHLIVYSDKFNTRIAIAIGVELSWVEKQTNKQTNKWIVEAEPNKQRLNPTLLLHQRNETQCLCFCFKEFQIMFSFTWLFYVNLLLQSKLSFFIFNCNHGSFLICLPNFLLSLSDLKCRWHAVASWTWDADLKCFCHTK